MDVYLQKSEVIRDIFELGPPKTAVETKDGKPTKQAKVMRAACPIHTWIE